MNHEIRIFEYKEREDETTGEPDLEPIAEEIEDANVEIEVILLFRKCSTFNEVIKTQLTF